MAKVMTYSDQFGNTNAASYWRIVQLNIGVADRTATAILYGYKSKAAYKAGAQPIGQKSYAISGADFDALMAKHVTNNPNNIQALAYTDVIGKINDVPAPTPTDPNAKKNFFD